MAQLFQCLELAKNKKTLFNYPFPFLFSSTYTIMTLNLPVGSEPEFPEQYYGNTITLANYMSFDSGVSRMKQFRTWTPFTPTEVSGDITITDTSGTAYHQVGNQVVVNLNIDFVKDAPATTTIVLGGLPQPATAGTIYTNALRIFTGATQFTGSLSIDPASSPTELIIRRSVVFVSPTAYTVTGILTYQAV